MILDLCQSSFITRYSISHVTINLQFRKLKNWSDIYQISLEITFNFLKEGVPDGLLSQWYTFFFIL